MNSAPPEAPLTEPRYLPWGQTARVPLQGLFHEYLSVCSEQIAFPSCFACHDTRWEVTVCRHMASPGGWSALPGSHSAVLLGSNSLGKELFVL